MIAMNKKRGQISLFIILGLLILLVTALFVYFNQYFFQYLGVSSEIKPIVNIIEGCVQETAEQGLLLASLQGGYLQLPDELAYLPDATVDLGFKVPLWYYNQKNTAPALSLIEEQLADHIEQKTSDCFGDFKSLQEQYVFGPVPTPEVKVNIGDDRVVITFTMPLKVTTGTEETIIPTLTFTKDNTFGKKYKLATTIMQKENKDNFLEKLTDEIIASSDYLPYEGMEFTCQPRIWLDQQIDNHLQEIIQHNLPRLYFTDTATKAPDDLYYKNVYTINLNTPFFKDLIVKTIVPSQAIHAEVHPKENGKVTYLNMVADTFMLPCVKVYHHKYDLTYNVLFEIKTDAVGEDTIPFYFATPIIVKRNEPNRNNEIEPWPSEVLELQSKAFCERQEDISLYTLNPEKGVITAVPAVTENWKYELQVYAIDNILQQPIADATVKYRCGRLECDIGTTAYNNLGIPFLRDKFPTCLNGKIVVERKGYFKSEEIQTIDETAEQAIVNVPLTRLLPYSYGVVIIENHNDAISERPLEADETAVITVSSNDEKYPYEKTLVYPTTAFNDGVIEKTTEEFHEENPYQGFDLLAADITYTVDITVVKNDQYRGGYYGNFTTTIEDALNNNHLDFIAIVKDPLLPAVLPEEFLEIMNYAKDISPEYQQRLAKK